MLTQIDEVTEQLIDVCHVEVPRHHEIPAAPVVLPEERMNVFDAVHSVSAVPKMAEPELTGECEVAFEPPLVTKLIFSLFLSFSIFFSNFFEKAGDRLALH